MCWPFLPATAIFQSDYRQAFFWLLQRRSSSDATDGALARFLRVEERLPWFKGAKLDDIVDYLCYVSVPALHRVACASACRARGPCRSSRRCCFQARTDSTATTRRPTIGIFWGLPLASGTSLRSICSSRDGRGPANGVILLTLAALVFVPVRYLYPSAWIGLQNAPRLLLGVIVGALVLVMVRQLHRSVACRVPCVSCLSCVYYVGLSFWLDVRRRSGRLRDAG